MRLFQVLTVLAVAVGIIVSVAALYIQYNYYILRKTEIEKL